MKKTYEVKIEDGINGKMDKSLTFVSSKPTEEVFNKAINRAIDSSIKMYEKKFSETINDDDDIRVQGFRFSEFKVIINEILMLHMTFNFSK
jgi:ribosomal protein S20|tara:strand:- start:122 stop:394 length:273 start_codon:yes stop_codon:yes gene_type:complete